MTQFCARFLDIYALLAPKRGAMAPCPLLKYAYVVSFQLGRGGAGLTLATPMPEPTLLQAVNVVLIYGINKCGRVIRGRNTATIV